MAANREYGRLQRTLSRISGTVHATQPRSEPVLVVAFQETKEGLHAVNYEVLLEAGAYTLLLSEGRFRVFAFEDQNHDFIHQPDEPIGELRRGIELENESSQLGMDIQLGAGVKDAPPIDLSSKEDNRKLENFRSAVGTVVNLDDPRFSRKSGVHGMWRPISAFNRNRVGVFFLEAYDPCRTPVLFIHGMQGSPQDLRPLMERLDRRRYQAWFFAYPSGLRLRFLARYLAESMREIGVRHRPRGMHIVAHSMGGLIARAFINQNAALKKKELIRTFITISTPFNGHDGAKIGVQFSPVVAPAWIDMTPNSQFIQSIYEAPLPEYVEHHLLFGFGGTSGVSNDGSVTLRSMLDPRAQNAAVRVYGFDEQHISILEEEPSMQRVLGILSRAPQNRQKECRSGVGHGDAGDVRVRAPDRVTGEPDEAPVLEE